MVLDILDYLGVMEADLSVYELSFVRDLQKKKNDITAKYEADQEALLRILWKNGTLRSSIQSSRTNELTEKYNAEIDQLIDDLDFKLHFFQVTNEASGAYSYPENPDYTLSAADRYYIVYNYYMTMSDPTVRFALFQADELAPDYLGNFYATLYEKLRSYVRT